MLCVKGEGCRECLVCKREVVGSALCVRGRL